MHIIHETIGAPKLKIEKVSRTTARLMVSPLPSGYGTTLGNALRRVLLSSCQGPLLQRSKFQGFLMNTVRSQG